VAERAGSAQAARTRQRPRDGRRGARARLVMCALCAAGCGAAPQPRPARAVTPHVYTIESLRTPVVAAAGDTCRSREVRTGGFLSEFLRRRIGERIVVQIDEPDDSRAEPASRKDGSRLFGLAAAIARSHPGLDVRDALVALSALDAPQEETPRCRPSLALRVSRELPGGELFVEGTKVLVAATTELHVYVAGVIRPRDITEDASVRSSLVADAEVEFVGRGVSTDARTEPWLQALLAARRAR